MTNSVAVCIRGWLARGKPFSLHLSMQRSASSAPVQTHTAFISLFALVLYWIHENLKLFPFRASTIKKDKTNRSVVNGKKVRQRLMDSSHAARTKNQFERDLSKILGVRDGWAVFVGGLRVIIRVLWDGWKKRQRRCSISRQCIWNKLIIVVTDEYFLYETGLV